MVPFERTHNQLKTYPVDFSNSAGKLLNDANSHSRDGQCEHSFCHSNSYEQYFHNLPGRQTQPFVLFGLPPVRSRIPKHTYSVSLDFFGPSVFGGLDSGLDSGLDCGTGLTESCAHHFEASKHY